MTSAIRAAGFEIGPEIGRGGFGVVYRARQVDLARTVAVKVLAGTFTATERARFEHECRIVGSLPPHPAIVAVYHAGATDAGVPFLAMAHLPGGTLGERAPLPAGDVARIGAVLADALAVAHAGGVVHRDVKPSNVLFADDGSPVLVDFGIASLAGEGPTSTGSIALSLAYAPPETLDGADSGPASDVYALGATLFAALTGTAPFSVPGDNAVTRVAMRIARDGVEDLRPRGVPDALCRVIETAMAKRPEQRFASMADFRDALDAARAEDAAALTALIPAGPAPVPVARRRRVLVGGGVAAVLVAGVVTAVALTAGSSTSGHPSAHGPGSSSGGGSTAQGAAARSSSGSTGADSTRRSGGPGSGTASSPPGAVVVGNEGGRSGNSGRAGPTSSATHSRTTHPTIAPPAPPTPTAPAPRRAVLAGRQECTLTVRVGSTASIPARCSGWRRDWNPSSSTNNRHVAWVAGNERSSNPNIKVTSSGYDPDSNTWTVRAGGVTTVDFYYRIRSAYRGSDGTWHSAGVSNARDWITVRFVR